MLAFSQQAVWVMEPLCASLLPQMVLASLFLSLTRGEEECHNRGETMHPVTASVFVALVVAAEENVWLSFRDR